MRHLFAAVLLAFGIAASAHADVTWNWSFAGQAGQFVTDGSLTDGKAAAGTYSLLDFSVTTATAGESIGTGTGGVYWPEGFSTTMPYAFNWDGSAVRLWDSAGSNTFDWWPLHDVKTGLYIFFGTAPGPINDPTNAIVWNLKPFASGKVTVSVAAVPEPETYAMLMAGLAILGAIGRRKTGG